MQKLIRNVIVRDFSEIQVFTYDSREKAEKCIKNLKKEILTQEWMDEQEFIKKQQEEYGEDAIVWETEYIDIYWKDYEAYIEQSKVL